MQKSLDNLVVMGRVAVPYGVKGWMKIQTFSESLDTLADYAEWYIKRGNDWQVYTVEEAKVHTKVLVAALVGIHDRDQALALKGCEIAVKRESLPAAPEGEYYWSDLIGLNVVNLRGDAFGVIEQILEAGAHDVLEVRGDRKHLIPFVGQIVRHVDLAARTVQVDWELDY
ncbi:ribosome maturation factor RimM [Sulfuriferula thiophila]|uniref:ribosome maturation factor RimM n=1 Tax=Sulfuriferula thiophila TaxID=1781211 RepID=UPI001CB8FA9F|nr:ribosome maturation factor RimM [Sulfuriferula thiophila]